MIALMMTIGLVRWVRRRSANALQGSLKRLAPGGAEECFAPPWRAVLAHQAGHGSAGAALWIARRDASIDGHRACLTPAHPDGASRSIYG